MSDDKFFRLLKWKIHTFIMLAYGFCDKFPKNELYGIISQLKRAAISVMLNFVEGYARRKLKVKLQFFETSYGSSKECKYLLFFTQRKGWITKEEYDKAFKLLDEINAMIWSLISGLDKEIDKENR